MKFLRYVGLIVLWVCTVPVRAQEEKYLDTTPQDVYNPTTTLFITQEHIQYNQGTYRPVAEDMSISGIHRFTFVQQYGNKLQNLGNNGTASRPIFYTLPEEIGVDSGFYAYDIYFRNPNQFRYYDTKSPYTKLYVMAARFGSLFADVCHSRNVTPSWNIGFNFRKILTDKEWIPVDPPGDRNVVAYGLDIFTHYKTENRRYQLLAHGLLMKHRVRETGGIFNMEYIRSAGSNLEQILFRSGIDNRLREVENSDKRNRFHLYHQLEVGEQIWAYHELGLQKKQHLFFINEDARVLNADERDKRFLSDNPGAQQDPQLGIQATTSVRNAQNELGLKSEWRDLFYSGYYRHKNTALQHEESRDQREVHEHYVGLRTRYHLAEDRTDYLHLGGEYLLKGFYKACVGYQGAIFDLACEQVRYQPSFLAQCYHGYCRNWDHSFAPPIATQIRGSGRLGANMLQFRPSASFTRIKKYIYFRNLWGENKVGQRLTMVALPQQDTQHADVITLGTDLGVALGQYIHWDSEFTLARVLGPSTRIFHIPALLINSRLYYARTATAGDGTMETGIDMHWKSAYKADAYDPITQQFYLQDDFNVYSYPVLDLFLNFRIKSFIAFLKFSHWNEYLFLPGYFVTPFYPGQKRAFDIGLNWSFFD